MGSSTAVRSCSKSGICFLVTTTLFSSRLASRGWEPKRERGSLPPPTVNEMKPLTMPPAGFHCTAVMEETGMRLVPLPTLVRARNPVRSIVTKSPLKVTVPLWPLAVNEVEFVMLFPVRSVAVRVLVCSRYLPPSGLRTRQPAYGGATALPGHGVPASPGPRCAGRVAGRRLGLRPAPAPGVAADPLARGFHRA